MRIYLKNNGYGLSEKFPMTTFEIEDVLDKLKQRESVVRFEISEYDNNCRRAYAARNFRRIFTGLICSQKGLKSLNLRR